MPASYDHAELKRQLSSHSLCSPDAVLCWKNLLSNAPVNSTKSQGILRLHEAKPRSKKQKSVQPKDPVVVIKNPACAQGDTRIHNDTYCRLSMKQKVALATDAVNLVLKTLSAAASEKGPGNIESGGCTRQGKHKAPKSHTEPHNVPNGKRSTCPEIQERCKVQRLAHIDKGNRQNDTVSTSGDCGGLLSLVECGRTAFAFLAEQSPMISDDNPSYLRLENARLVFVGKVLVFGFNKLACDELQALYHHLQLLLQSRQSSVQIGIKRGISQWKNLEAMACTRTAELLYFSMPETTPAALVYLIVNFQIAVLRSESFNSQQALASTVAKALDPICEDSSIAFLLKRLDSPSERERAMRLLDSLVCLLWQVSQTFSTPKSPTDLSITRNRFGIQSLSLKLRACSIKISGHEKDISNGVLAPFARCLSSFSKNCSNSPLEKFKLAKEMFTSLQQYVPQTRIVEEASTFEVLSFLSLLALETDCIEESQRLADEMKKNGALIPNMRLYAWSCKLATSCLRSFKDPAKSDLCLGYCENAIRCINGDLSGNFQDFEAVLGAVSELVKSASWAIKRSSYLSSKRSDVRSVLLKTLVSSGSLLIRYQTYFTKLSSQSIGPRAESSTVSRELYRSTIESILSILKYEQRTSEIIWHEASDALQVCWTLFEKFCQSVGYDNGYDDRSDGVTDILCVHISDLYWSIFVKLDEKSIHQRDQKITSLTRSCEILQMGGKQAKVMGNLPLKLCKLGRALLAEKIYHKAGETLSLAVEASSETGTLSVVVSNLRVKPLQAVVNDSDPIQVLGSALKSHLSLFLEHVELPCFGEGLYDNKSLSLEERGALLEWQLMLLTSPESTCGRIDSLRFSSLCSQLGRLLLQVYDSKRFPLRRQRVLIDLLMLEQEAFGTSESLILMDEVEDAARMFSQTDLGNDQGLQEYKQHLRASLTTCLAVRSKTLIKLQMTTATKIWTGLIDDCKTSEALSRKIYDFNGWISQLEMMTDFADIQGFERLRLCNLHLLSKVYELLYGRQSDECNLASIRVAHQYLRLGHTSRAGRLLGKIRMETKYMGPRRKHLNYLDVAELEYYTILCDFSECNRRIQKIEDGSQDYRTGEKSVNSLSIVKEAISEANLLRLKSRICTENGDQKQMFIFAKQSTYLLQRAWARRENHKSSPKPPYPTDSPSDLDSLVQSVRDLAFETNSVDRENDRFNVTVGPYVWPLVRPILQSLLWMVQTAMHCGDIQEVKHAYKQAERLADGLGSDTILSSVLVENVDIACLSGETDEGRQLIDRIAVKRAESDQSKDLARQHRCIGTLLHLEGHCSAEIGYYETAQHILREVSTFNHLIPFEGINTFIAPAPESQPTPLTAASMAHNSRHITQNRSKTRKKAVEKAINCALPMEAAPAPSQSNDCFELELLQSDLARLTVECLIERGRNLDATKLLSHIPESKSTTEHHLRIAATRAKQSLAEGEMMMSKDSVLSMLTESALSLPATSLSEQQMDSCGYGGEEKVITKSIQNSASFVDYLFQSIQSVSETYYGSASSCSTFTLSECQSVLITSSLMLSISRPNAEKHGIHAAKVACAIETPRNHATHREIACLNANRMIKENIDAVTSTNATRSERDETDLLKSNLFQQNFVDIIPDSWTAVSVSVSEDQKYLHLVRYRAKQPPFVLRLPLTRQHAEDPDEEALPFREAKAELLDIINKSDETVHDAKTHQIDMKVKGAKTKWWRERETLDERLKNLLLNIENMWLGGFRGLFSQVSCPVEVLARLQQTFNNILDKHLPSRCTSLKRDKRTSRVKLHPQVLELFAGLGDPEEHDLDEPLMDLLYHVVDILQLNGESNAYDEIDFDTLVIDTQNALHSYHTALRHSQPLQPPTHTHTILILDKPLHAIPWESLPCLQNQSVSRTTSLLDVRDRILLMQQQQACLAHHTNLDHPQPTHQQGIHISRHSGTSILNPSVDLQKTQARFEKPLSSLTGRSSTSDIHPSWTHITARPPSESEFATALTSPVPPTTTAASNDSPATDAAPHPSLLLYFGHGSGSQYIRSKTIKRLRPRCNAALLFGCGSASLREARAFEPYGTPRAYLAAGAPAVLGALWDVTDGDCDLVAEGVLQGWGLFGRGAGFGVGDGDGGAGAGAGAEEGSGGTQRRRQRQKQRRKGKGGKEGEDGKGAREREAREQGGGMSLSGALATARDSAYLRYLNGAAMVVYGVPVYLSS